MRLPRDRPRPLGGLDVPEDTRRTRTSHARRNGSDDDPVILRDALLESLAQLADDIEARGGAE